MLPIGVGIDPKTGELSPATGRYEKRLGELGQIYQDKAAFSAADGHTLAYEVIEYRAEGSDIIFGTTVMQPGKVGDEYFMTRGHFHVRRDRGEVYYTQSGEGVLLLESRGGETRMVEMKPGVCAFIPADWAHRSINTGKEKLVFVWVCEADAGHEYGEIMSRGMRSLVVERNGKPVIVPNPKWAA
jgi:glucose-6-phosphate isomerase